MNKEVKELEQKFGKRIPFRVPDNYFDNFTSELMEKLPNTEGRVIRMQTTIWHRLRPTMIVAATVLAAAFCVNFYFNRADHNNLKQANKQVIGNTQQSSYSAFDQAADYTMLDNEQIYAYVSEN